MKKLLKTSKGFTLIELLIVIALLGALAVGLIGAIDPFEQLKKGTDTGTRDLVSQVQTAVIRYYSVKNSFPDWNVTSGTTYQMATLVNGTPVINATLQPGLDQIIAAGELTSNFTDVHGSQLVNIYLTQTNAGAATSARVDVCYQPQSKSFQADQNTKYTSAGVEEAAGTCLSDGGTQQCYWCVQ